MFHHLHRPAGHNWLEQPVCMTRRMCKWVTGLWRSSQRLRLAWQWNRSIFWELCSALAALDTTGWRLSEGTLCVPDRDSTLRLKPSRQSLIRGLLTEIA